ncbi:uncharacterized protein LOC134957124 [Pseudophryne corroboree]|uniref:uncharacterized protein LOC134957124 n=1 Tax=Pseudophryne corroboree TaxID=495146 RepID=UPI0030813898
MQGHGARIKSGKVSDSDPKMLKCYYRATEEQGVQSDMHQTSVPKKGTGEQEGCRKVAALSRSYDGAADTEVDISHPSLCPKAHLSATLGPGEWTDWTGNRRGQQDACLHKAAADTRCRKDEIHGPPAQRGNRSALPLIQKGAGREPAPRKRNAGSSKDTPPTLKASNKGGKDKSLPLLASDMTPWVGASPSETSLTALLRSIPSPRTCFVNMADHSQGQRDPQPAIKRQDSGDQPVPLPEQQPLRDKTSSRAKQRGRTGVTKRRPLSKFHTMKLPPVPAVTELSFSRNFSFSFFELPEHQSPQHWLQRQRSVYMLMRRLE